MSDIKAQNRQENLTRLKVERLEARISKDNKELFQRAADIQGQTLRDFVITSLVSAANQVIQQHDTMTLSRKDQEVFVEALLNPPAPSPKLQAAAQRYRKNMGV